MVLSNDDAIKVGLIGLGFAGTHLHLGPLMQNRRAKLVFAADLDAQKIAAFKISSTSFADVLTSTDWRDVTQSSSVDAVIVATPTTSHLEIVSQALSAGKHVFCEKPVSINIEDALKMRDHARRHPDKVLMIGQVLRFWPDYVEANKLVASGKIGAPRIARTQRTVPMPSGWYTQEELSGGVTLDLLLHDIDFLVWTMGRVKTVYAQGNNCLGRGDKSFIDFVQVHLTFETGAIAHLEASWAVPDTYPFTTALEISGTAGMLSMDNSPQATSLEQTIKGQPMARSAPSERNGYFFEQDAFFAAVKQNNCKSPVSVDDVLHPLEVALAAKQSIKTGENVSLNALTEGIGAVR